jgi:hypothetical protein
MGATELLAVLWIAISAVVGYYIGKPKGEAGVGGLLGPLGWIISAISRGNQKDCPYCMKLIHPQATVCPYCQREQHGS